MVPSAAPTAPGRLDPDVAVRLASTVGRIGSSAIRDLLAVAERPDVISLAGGLPAPDAFPLAAVAAATAAELADGPGALQYSATQGDAGLRAWIGARTGVDADHVLVTQGSQQALDLVARALVEPGDEVAVGDPAYVGAVQALRLAGARLLPVPVDTEGMRVDVLAERIAAGHRPVLVHVVATFDNPTGATLSPERRVALAELAERHGFLVVEDDPYGELRFDRSAPAPVPLRALTGRAVSLGSTSKVLCPGLRIGWLSGPPALVAATTLLKQAADLHTATLAQRVAHRVLADAPGLAAHLGRLRLLYGGRAEALVSALDREVGDRLSLNRPEGGMFLWGELDGVDTAALLPRAIEAGVAFVPGPVFATGDPTLLRHHLRLSFATAGDDDLAEGARRLAGCLD